MDFEVASGRGGDGFEADGRGVAVVAGCNFEVRVGTDAWALCEGIAVLALVGNDLTNAQGWRFLKRREKLECDHGTFRRLAVCRATKKTSIVP